MTNLTVGQRLGVTNTISWNELKWN